MANWIRSEVSVRSKDRALLEQMVSAAQEKKLLEFLRPFTEETDHKWDYTWCVENWGTKWDIGELIYSDISPTILPEEVDMWGVEDDGIHELSIDFETAWTPPTEAFLYGAKALGFEFNMFAMQEVASYEE
jgi:hypothetical protein